MANLKVRKFNTIDQVQHFLDGGITGGSGHVKPREGGPPGANLVGLTLTFLNPVGTVTFVAGVKPNGFLLYQEFKGQIEGAIATVVVKMMEDGSIAFIEATPTTGVVLKGDGTAATNANQVLGFDKDANAVGKVYGSPYSPVPAVAPYFVQMYSSNDNTHVVTTYE